MSSPGNYEGGVARNLSLDFNPRDLAVDLSGSAIGAASPVSLDAVYVPSRARADYVSQLLTSLPESAPMTYLLPSCDSDLPVITAATRTDFTRLTLEDRAFRRLVESFRVRKHSVFATSERDWDLPLKRSYALWHARRSSFEQILLLDDDILGLTERHLQSGSTALSHFTVAGFFVDQFADTSVIGHIERAAGELVLPFLSGSCLFVRADRPVGPFPPIYNEDWIFMAPEIACGRVSSLGAVSQRAYDPFSREELVVFQEPGEIIADGLFALLAADRFAERLKAPPWLELLKLRRAWLSSLAKIVQKVDQQRAVCRAYELCNQITAKQCVQFLADWEHDRDTWNVALTGLT